MRLYPAIDIKGGKCVRLKQGRFNDVTVYSDDPSEIAKKWSEAGASFIHVVDLDGALAGCSVNEEAMKRMVREVKIPIQTGGGIRTAEDIERRLSIGISRVIIGTKAVSDPEFVETAVRNFGSERIVIGLDAKDGMVAVEGWEKVSTNTVAELAVRMKKIGVKTIVYTDIAKDGMLSGPNFKNTEELIKLSDMDIIASGGVSTMEDLRKLSNINAGGAIIGKALYEGCIDLRQAVETFENAN